jgi:hypothetical protein
MAIDRALAGLERDLGRADDRVRPKAQATRRSAACLVRSKRAVTSWLEPPGRVIAIGQQGSRHSAASEEATFALLAFRVLEDSQNRGARPPQCPDGVAGSRQKEQR